jgi:hypothetical protein
MFSQPIDPECDSCPTYFQVVAHPMHLGTICAKLRKQEYDSVANWQEGVNLIWENAFTSPGHQSLVSLLARQLQGIFKELTIVITPDEKRDWLNKLAELADQSMPVSKSEESIQPPKLSKLRRTASQANEERPRPK